MKYANLDQLSPLWVPRFSNCQHFLSFSIPYFSFSSACCHHVACSMLGRVIGSPFLTGTATNCSNRYEVSPVLATKHDFAGRMLSSGRKAGVTIYRVYLRQEMPCMQWHKFIFENKIYRNKLYKNYNVAAYTMKLRISENILNLKISIEIPQHRPQIAKDTFWWQPSAHLFCYGKNAILWHAFQPQGLRHKIDPIMLKMHSKKAYQIMDLIPIPNTYQLVNLKQCLYQVHTIL